MLVMKNRKKRPMVISLSQLANPTCVRIVIFFDKLGQQKKTPRLRCFSFFSPSINENRIRRPVPGTFVPDMEHQQTMVREYMSR